MQKYTSLKVCFLHYCKKHYCIIIHSRAKETKRSLAPASSFIDEDGVVRRQMAP